MIQDMCACDHWLRRLLLPILLLGLLLTTQAAAAQTNRSDSFWALVEQSEQSFREQPISDEELTALIEAWVQEGGRTGIDTTYIVDALEAFQAAEPDDRVPSELITLFSSLNEAQAAWPSGDGLFEPSGENQTEILDQILAQPAYNWDDNRLFDFSQVLERFFRWLFDFLPASGSGIGQVDPGNGVIVVWVLVILTAAILLFVLYRLLRGVSFGLVKDGSTDLRDPLGDELANLSPAEALSNAQQNAESGNLRHAVRYLYLSTLLTLEEKGVFRYDKGLTNREYIRSINHRPELSALLSDVVDVFDRVWYGFQPIDHDAFERYQARIQALQEPKRAELAGPSQPREEG